MKVLKPVHPNAGIEAAYRRALLDLVDEMVRSYERWIVACYRKHEPVMAQDATPAVQLRYTLNDLRVQWEKRFNAAAPKLARHFLKDASERSDASLRRILKQAGITVQFKMTAAAKDIIAASVAENVSLIKSINQQYHTEIEGLVMRSVVAGRDLGPLAKELRARYHITKKRAALISRDQNNKATSAMQRARQSELGITEAIWLHSGGGKEPRETHVRNSGKKYNIMTGWFDPDKRVRKYIWPGELINCRCVSKSVIKGFS